MNKNLKAMSDYTITSRYARYLPENKRRATWKEQIYIVKDMHLQKYPEAKDDIDWAFDFVEKKRVLGSQRALQFGGDPILKKNARIYNCTASYADRTRFFQESFWLLLCGVGVGFSVQRHHIAKLPKITKRGNTKYEVIENDKIEEVTYVIPDSIEGWADSLGVLLSSYFIEDQPFPEYFGKKINFDFSLIRPKGAPLASGVGKAPGPKGLKNALIKIEHLLDSIIGNSDVPVKLKPINVYDIVMHSSDAVLSGGVRRSATLCLFSPDDEEMAKAKTGNWKVTNPQRGRSNNSALLIRGETSFEKFKDLIENVKEHGEPGFVWSDNAELLVNPCLDGNTLITTNKGEVPLKTVVEKPFNYKALSYNIDLEKTEYKNIRSGVKTKENTKTIKIDFDDNSFIYLTPEHLVLTKRGYVKAINLIEEDEIITLNKDIEVNDNKNIEISKRKYIEQNKWTTRIINSYEAVE